jgi:hypothetical protein
MMVTTLYAGILGLIYIGLSFYVIRGRFKNQVSLGDAGNADMLKRIRIHANFIEYVPIALLLLVLAEFEGTSEILIHGLCSALIIGRISHAFGVMMKDGASLWRGGGMILTFLVIAITSVICIQSFFIF